MTRRGVLAQTAEERSCTKFPVYGNASSATEAGRIDLRIGPGLRVIAARRLSRPRDKGRGTRGRGKEHAQRRHQVDEKGRKKRKKAKRLNQKRGEMSEKNEKIRSPGEGRGRGTRKGDQDNN